jgi:signal transduction histidine kinase
MACVLDIRTGGSSAQVLAYNATPSLTNLINARIRASGVAGTFYDESRLTGFAVFVPDAASIEALTPAAPPFSGKLRNTRSTFWFSPTGARDYRITIRGVVAVHWPGRSLFVKDEAGTIRVDLAASAPVQAGDKIDASGFIRRNRGTTWLAEGMVRRRAGEKESPHPTLSSVHQLESIGSNDEYVSVEGAVVSAPIEKGGVSTFILESGGYTAAVFVPGDAGKNIRLGSRVNVTGCWSDAPPGAPPEWARGVWINGMSNASIIAPPPHPPALPQDSSPFVWAAPASAGLLLGLCGIWLSRRKQHKAMLEASELRGRLEETERQARQLAEARDRLGRDLHDHIIQSIYALGLNVEDCVQLLGKEPEKAEARLRSALMDVNGVIRELRHVILGLESNAIQPQEFRTALKSLALALGHENSNRTRLDLNDEALAALSPAQSTELIHIAREALSNSVRHGRAQTTSFALEVLGEKIRFTIEDDGRGFDPANQERNGFGLRNMAKRAEDLGAIFTIQAQEGHGTRIMLDIPRQKQHFSPRESRASANR